MLSILLPLLLLFSSVYGKPYVFVFSGTIPTFNSFYTVQLQMSMSKSGVNNSDKIESASKKLILSDLGNKSDKKC